MREHQDIRIGVVVSLVKNEIAPLVRIRSDLIFPDVFCSEVPEGSVPVQPECLRDRRLAASPITMDLPAVPSVINSKTSRLSGPFDVPRDPDHGGHE